MRKRRGIEPLDLLALVAVFGALVVVIGPVDDINDVFWHVLIGRELLDGAPFSELGSTFSATVENPNWRTGAWASEVLMAVLHEVGGWPLVVGALRLGSILGVAGILWWGVVREYPSRVAVPPFVLAMTAMALTVQERPQSLSFIAIALTAVWWLRSVVFDSIPRWWVVGIVSMVWANFHGLWVLLPMAMALALIGRWLDHGRHDAGVRQLSLATASAVVGGLLTPLGFYGWLLPIRLQNAGGIIVEWQRTQPLDGVGYVLLIASGATLLLLGREWRRSFIVYGVSVTVFGLAAIRNVAPAVLLLTPLLTVLADSWLGGRALTPVSARERRKLHLAAAGILTVGLVAVTATLFSRDAGPRDDLPVEAMETLTNQEGPVRLLNEYNWSGVALFYGPSDLRVAIDGRADFYGGAFIVDHEEALGGIGLSDLVADFDPTHALLEPNRAAVQLLQAQGWSVLEETDGYVLLESPS